jgi:hypothetical protein
MVEKAPQLSAQERAGLFAQATRQNLQTMPTQSISQENQSLSFTLPKARLLSKIYLNVEAVATLKSNTAAIPLDAYSPFQILRRVSLDLNNGFMPFIVDGRSLMQYNMVRLNPSVYNTQKVTERAMNYVETAASVGGTDAKIQFTIELPITLNPRDPVGLVLLQNEATQVSLTVDVATLSKAYVPNVANVDSVTFKSLKVTPVVETFTIPSVPQAFPDLSVLKLVSAKGDTFAGGGQNVLKLNVGTIYRKMIVYLEDANGVPFKDIDIQGNIELVFNQSDIPYSIKPSVLAHLNASQLGYNLPDGMFVFDFTNNGIPNLGGSRDYVDTEKLSEFWIRFSSTKSGKITVVSENLARLR